MLPQWSLDDFEPFDPGETGEKKSHIVGKGAYGSVLKVQHKRTKRIIKGRIAISPWDADKKDIPL